MKILAISLLFSATTVAVAVDIPSDPVAATKNVIQRDGTFYSEFSVEGKNYYKGQWYEEVDLSNASFLPGNKMLQAYGVTDAAGIAAALGYYPGSMSTMLSDYGFSSIDEIGQMYGYSNYDEWVNSWWGYDPGQDTIASWWGYKDYNNPPNEAAIQQMFSDYGANNLNDLAMNLGYAGGTPSAAEFATLLSPNRLKDPANVSSLFTDTNIYGEESQTLGEAISAINTAMAANPDVDYSSALWDAILTVGANTPELKTLDVSDLTLTGQNLSYQEWLHNTGFTGTQINAASNLTYANFSGMNLTGIDLTGKNIRGANFSGATGITGANLNSASNMDFTVLGGLDLTGLNLTGKYVAYVDFSNSNITAAQLNAAQTLGSPNLSGLDLTGVNLSGTRVTNANFSGATGINYAQINAGGGTNIRGSSFAGNDVSALVLTNKNITHGNYSNTNLTAAQLAAGRWEYMGPGGIAVNVVGTGITPQALQAALQAQGLNASTVAWMVDSVRYQ